MWKVKEKKKQKKKYKRKKYLCHCTVQSELLLSVGETNLTGEEIAVVSDSVRGVHEYLRDGRQVFNALHLHPQQVSVKGLPVDCL